MQCKEETCDAKWTISSYSRVVLLAKSKDARNCVLINHTQGFQVPTVVSGLRVPQLMENILNSAFNGVN
jgi:hypothetical protein